MRTRGSTPPHRWTRRDRRAPRAAIWLLLHALVAAGLGCGDDTDGRRYRAVAGEGNARADWEVTVGVVDEDARPVEADRVSARSGRPGARSEVVGERVGPGQFLLRGGGAGPVTIRVLAGGKQHTLEHPIASPRATLVVPVGGKLEIAWSLPRSQELFDGRLVLVVESSLSPDRRIQRDIDRRGRIAGAAAIPYLAPGEYLASLELWRDADAPGGRDPLVVPLTAPRLLRIEAGELTRIPLGGES